MKTFKRFMKTHYKKMLKSSFEWAMSVIVVIAVAHFAYTAGYKDGSLRVFKEIQKTVDNYKVKRKCNGK